MTFQKRLPPVGSRPGTLSIPPDSPPPKIQVFDYDADGVEESEIDDPEELRRFVQSSRRTWVDVQGLGDEAKLRKIAEILDLHRLTLEDVTNVPQRAKSEEFDRYQVIVGRAPLLGDDGKLQVPQVCMILGRNFLVTFQDRYFGFFDGVRERLRLGGGPMRSLGPDYLAYALLDALVDHYFPIVEHLATELEELEDDVSENPGAQCLAKLHVIRRQLVIIRRIGWPQREALRSLAREESNFIQADTIPYLQSTETHATQIMEAVDSSREMTSGLVDIYLSSVSHRTNEVMKVLTLMASIFIPLTFIAGIYGMNFEHMPELRSRNGYFVVLFVMVAVAIGMIGYFSRKGWLGERRRD